MRETDSNRVRVDDRQTEMYFLDIEGVRQESVAIIFSDTWGAPVVMVRDSAGELESSARMFSLEKQLLTFNDWTDDDGVEDDNRVEVTRNGDWDIVCIEGVAKSSVAIDHYKSDNVRICVHTENPEEPDHIIPLLPPARETEESRRKAPSPRDEV